MARRKKNKTEPKRNMVLEYKGWKAGDRCYTVFSGETKPSLCDIKEFHPTDSVTPSVSVIEVTTGKHRVAARHGNRRGGKSSKAAGTQVDQDTRPVEEEAGQTPDGGTAR